MTSRLIDANARLAESVRARDEFVSVASHEIKTPLTSVKPELQMETRRLAGGGAGVPKWLDLSLRQIRRLETLTAALLDATRLRAGQLDVKPDLSRIVASVAARFSVTSRGAATSCSSTSSPASSASGIRPGSTRC
jgi:signal transduction histidine kinase